MRQTYVLDQDTPSGRLRVGLFRCAGSSVRQIAAYLSRRLPHLPQDGQGLYVARRHWIMGQWGDGELLPLEPKDNT